MLLNTNHPANIREEDSETPWQTGVHGSDQAGRRSARAAAEPSRRDRPSGAHVDRATSDHGDYLGNHWLGEKGFFHEPSVKIPLIICDLQPKADATRGRPAML
jgi:hypothetical protein